MTKGKLTSIDKGYKTVTIDEKKFSYEGTPAEKFIHKIEFPCLVEYSIKRGTSNLSFVQTITEEQFNDPNYPPKKPYPEGKSPFRPPTPPPEKASKEAQSQFKTGTEIMNETKSDELWQCMTEGCENPVSANERRISEQFLGTNVVICSHCMKAIQEAQRAGEEPEIPKARLPEKFEGEIPPEPHSDPQNGSKVSEPAPTQEKPTPQRETTNPVTSYDHIYPKEQLIAMVNDNYTYWKSKFISDLQTGDRIGLQASLNTATEIVNKSPDCGNLSAKERSIKVMQIAMELRDFVGRGGTYEEVEGF